MLLREEGFRIHVPSFFGGLAPDSALRRRFHTITGMAKVCVRREFACIATKKTSRVSDWVRALAADIAPIDRPEGGVGVIGMCLTGGIVLATVAEKAVGAAVAAQPSLPWSPETSRWPVNRAVRQYSVGTEDDDLYDAIESRTPVLTVRFDDDPIYPLERFELVQRCFGAQPLPVPTTAVGEQERKKLHATLTGAFRPGVYEAAAGDSLAAVGEVVAFLRREIGSPALEVD
jgi:dienelactone hydrolase